MSEQLFQQHVTAAIEHPERLLALDSDEYRENRRKCAEMSRRKQFFFGGDVVSEIFNKDKIRAAREFQGQMITSLGMGGLAAAELGFMVRSMLRERTIIEHPLIQQVTGGFVGDAQAPGRVLRAINEQTLPYDLLIRMAEARQKAFLSERTSFDKELPDLKVEYMQQLRRLVALPHHAAYAETLNIDGVSGRLDDVAVLTVDPLILALKPNSLTFGEYSHEQNYVTVAYDRPWTYRKSYVHTLRHEWNHVVSGRSVAPEGYERCRATRIGMRIYDPTLKRSRYKWLNEAITETMACDIANPNTRDWNLGAYIQERYLYKKLLQRIPEGLFLGSYFEDADPRKPHNGIIYRPRLISAVDREYGSGFLQQLDDRIHADGAAKVGAMFDMDGRWKGG